MTVIYFHHSAVASIAFIMSTVKLVPKPPSTFPPPSCITTDDEYLYAAYMLVCHEDAKRPEELRLAGDDYMAALEKKLEEVKALLTATALRIQNGKIYQEIKVDLADGDGKSMILRILERPQDDPVVAVHMVDGEVYEEIEVDDGDEVGDDADEDEEMDEMDD